MGKLGNLRAYYMVSLCCIGSFLFAYDTGIIGGILTLSTFEKSFGYSSAEATNVNSTAVSILQAGAFFGCIFTWPITARFGRRWVIIASAFVFCIGAILQVIDSHSLPCFYVGRVISGLGIGAATVLVPMFCAEMAPRELRGRLGSFFQFFFTIGVCVSYWSDYGAKTHFSDKRQWQIPLGIQFIPAGFLLFGMFLIPESTRWLAKVGRNEEALASLIWIRGEDTPEVQSEFLEIQAGIEEEIRATEGVTIKELLIPSIRNRLALAFTLMLAQQLTGNTSLAYYSPQVFAAVGAGSNALLMSGFFGVAKVVGCATFLAFFAERAGRRIPLMSGAFAMGSFMLIISIVDATHPAKGTGNPTPASIASVIMIYFEAISFNMSWGPLCWVYIGEIFPTRVREIGVATGAASQWLFNFVMSQITPHALTNIGWRTFLMFAIFNYAIIGYTWLFIKETRGKSLEEMEIVFNSSQTAVDAEALRNKLAEEEEDDVPKIGASSSAAEHQDNRD